MKVEAAVAEALVGNVIGKLIHDLRVDVLNCDIGDMGSDDIKDVIDRGIQGQDIVDISIKAIATHDEVNRADRVLEVKIGAHLMQGRPPYRDLRGPSSRC